MGVSPTHTIMTTEGASDAEPLGTLTSLSPSPDKSSYTRQHLEDEDAVTQTAKFNTGAMSAELNNSLALKSFGML